MRVVGVHVEAELKVKIWAEWSSSGFHSIQRAVHSSEVQFRKLATIFNEREVKTSVQKVDKQRT